MSGSLITKYSYPSLNFRIAGHVREQIHGACRAMMSAHPQVPPWFCVQGCVVEKEVAPSDGKVNTQLPVRYLEHKIYVNFLW